MRHHFSRRDRRGELRFEIHIQLDLFGEREYVARVIKAVRIHASLGACPIRHAFGPHRGTTEQEALERATADIDSWIITFGATESR